MKIMERKSFADYVLKERLRKTRAKDFGIAIIKPKVSRAVVREISDIIAENNLSIISSYSKKLSRSDILALYHDIYMFSENDKKFGIEWKRDKLEYMSSGNCGIYLISGKSVQSTLIDIRNNIRGKYGKCSIPKKELSRQQFIDQAIKNIVHVVDDCELENALWLLFS